jgi:hypothetical protein
MYSKALVNFSSKMDVAMKEISSQERNMVREQ